MKKMPLLLVLACLSLPAAAEDSPAIVGLLEGATDLGRVNGTALACGYSDLVAKARAVMILRAPKTRRFGEAFEDASNAAFAHQGAPGAAACPEAVVLNLKLEMTELRMQEFAVQANRP